MSTLVRCLPGKILVYYQYLHEAKFEGREFDYLGQLIVTPTMVAMKIRDMKDNKSPGVDGIPPKLLLEIVEQISIPAYQHRKWYDQLDRKMAY